MIPLRAKFKLVALSMGVFVCHILMGVLIEIIFKTDYSGEKFNFPVAFVAVKNIAYAFIAKGDMIFLRLVKIKTFYILYSHSNNLQSSSERNITKIFHVGGNILFFGYDNCEHGIDICAVSSSSYWKM